MSSNEGCLAISVRFSRQIVQFNRTIVIETGTRLVTSPQREQTWRLGKPLQVQEGFEPNICCFGLAIEET